MRDSVALKTDKLFQCSAKTQFPPKYSGAPPVPPSLFPSNEFSWETPNVYASQNGPQQGLSGFWHKNGPLHGRPEKIFQAIFTVPPLTHARRAFGFPPYVPPLNYQNPREEARVFLPKPGPPIWHSPALSKARKPMGLCAPNTPEKQITSAGPNIPAPRVQQLLKLRNREETSRSPEGTDGSRTKMGPPRQWLARGLASHNRAEN